MSADWSLITSVIVFAAGAATVAGVAPRLVRLADRLAAETGLGEALFGAVFLGAITSLAGMVTSVTAAIDGFPALAYSNAVGGIAIQTLFLVAADFAYRRTNLEYAAASLSNLTFAALLIALLAVVLGAGLTPSPTLLGVHPATLVLFGGYLAGLRLVRLARTDPRWSARPSPATGEEAEAVEAPRGSLAGSFALLAAAGVAVAAAGVAIALGGAGIAERTGLSETFVGAVLTGATTSMAELATTVSAVRNAALVLAVGGIVGGNAFDVLFLGFADIAYRGGSLYHAVGPDQLLVLVAALLMTAVLLLGLLGRQERGPANVGAEAWAMVVIYFGMIALVATD